MKRILAVFLLLAPSCFGEMKNAIQTESGLLNRIAGRDSAITAFKGIPYAELPVGNLRWTAPQRKSSWTGIRKAAEFGNGCAQTFANASFPKSEDCLYLNIWTPALSASDALPVMFWIHGGGLSAGSMELAVAIRKNGGNAFLYFFSHLDAGGYNSEPPSQGLMLGAGHGAELPYVFGLLNRWKNAVPENDRIMQDRMMLYWTNFAKNLDPNEPGLPAWKPFNEQDTTVMSLEDDTGMKLHPRAEQIRFIQENARQ